MWSKPEQPVVSCQYQNWKWSIHYVFTSSSSFFLTIWNKRPVPTVNGWIEHSSVNVLLSVFWPLSSNGLVLDKIWKKRWFSAQNMLLLIRKKLKKVTILTGNILEWIDLSILLLLIKGNAIFDAIQLIRNRTCLFWKRWVMGLITHQRLIKS